MIKLPLTKGFEAIIDDDDYELVGRFKWYATPRKTVVYVKRGVWINGRPTKVYLHREVMQAPADVEVDHINGDGLDNRRANLRLATRGQNGANIHRPIGRSGYRGVWVDGRCGRYLAMGSDGTGRNAYLGRFDAAEDAARAYDKYASGKWGVFAKLNFPNGAA